MASCSHLVFSPFLCTSTLCRSRASFMTGYYPIRMGLQVMSFTSPNPQTSARAHTHTHLCWLIGIVLDVIYRECFFVHYLFSAQVNQTIFAPIYPIELHPSAASSERSRIRHTYGWQVWSSQWSSHLPHEKTTHTHCREEIGSSEKELKLTRRVPEGETKRRESRCWLWIVCHYIYWVTGSFITIRESQVTVSFNWFCWAWGDNCIVYCNLVYITMVVKIKNAYSFWSHKHMLST